MHICHMLCTPDTTHCRNPTHGLSRCCCVQVAQRSEQCDVEAVLLQAGAVNKQKDSWASLELKGGYL